MTFNNRIKALGYSMICLRSKLDEPWLDFLRDHHESISNAKLKHLINYFYAGKEIPYPLYKDREEVMDP